MSKTARSIAKLSALAMGVATAATMLAGSASATPNYSIAASESACNRDHTLCNITYGGGTRVDYVSAQRSEGTGTVGFFEVFGPSGYKKTDATTTQRQRLIEIHKNFPNGSLICLRFWRYDGPGHFTQVGGNVCTSIPIG